MSNFKQVAQLLPPALRRRAEQLPEALTARTEEVRLRCGREPTVLTSGGETPFPGEGAVCRRDLDMTVEIATRASAHAALERVRQGYFTVQGGHRIGLCGSAVTVDGEVRNLNALSSLNIRVARAVPGCAGPILDELTEAGKLQSTLILSPPGGGKTTLLRDLIRALSNEGTRFGLADERGEVAGLWDGTPQFDVGACTDVLDGCPKAQALMMLLRGMGPQVLACDEITAPADCAALGEAANCGVALLATAHGAGLDDLRARPLYRSLLEQNLFQRVVYIDRAGPRRYRVERLAC